MYALEAVQFGVLGSIALLALCMIIMLAESYLLGHNSSYLFVIFSAFLYQNNSTTVLT